jgi:NADPH2:quinone reductase
VKAEGGISIATTRTSNKKDELTKLGDHVIVTDEENYVARIAEITGGKVFA